MTFNMEFNHDDVVLVVDRNGKFDFRGKIAGRHDSNAGRRYDVQPEGEVSLSKRVNNLPEHQLRRVNPEVDKMVRAYSRLPDSSPKNIRDAV